MNIKKTTKAALLCMLVACFVLPINAQKKDDFFRIGDEFGGNRDVVNWTISNGLGGATQENPTPVGSGLLVFTIAGAGYAMARRKKTKTLLLSVILILGMTQCKKNEVAPSVDNGVYITLDAGYGNAKTGFTPSTGEFVWSNGVTEYIYVGGSEHADCLGVLSGTGTGTGSMTFSGSLTTTPNDKETLHFFYLGKGRDGSAVSTLDFSNQDGTLENVTNYHIAVGDGSYTSGNINYATTLDMTMAIAYFNVSGYQNASETAETVYLHGEDVYTTATVDYQTGTIAGATKGYLNMGAATASKYVALIPSVTTETTLKFDSNSKTGSMTFLRGVQAGKYYANSDAALAVTAGDLPDGTLKGIFSISETKKVRFSQGNLQYQASTNTWRFAEHQHDFVGDATAGSVYVGEVKSNNAYISNSYTGWIDLFGWGTWSGMPNQMKPTQTEKSYWLYEWIGDAYFHGTIANSTDNDWFTVSQEQMNCLLKTRNTTTINNVENARYSLAIINTDDAPVKGVILFPDSYVGGNPEGVVWNTINYVNSSYAQGTQCTTAGWDALNAYGCVFLPAVGGRDGTSVGNAGERGWYASSTVTPDISSDSEYALYFYSGCIYIASSKKWGGNAVRLVRDL